MRQSLMSIIALLFLVAGAAQAATQLVVNGGFESNGGVNTRIFDNWTVVDQAGSAGSFYVQTGTTAPSLHPIPVNAPPEGVFAAMASQNESSSTILYQDITMPTVDAWQTITFSAKVYVNNEAGVFVTPPTLDYGAGIDNQQARIDFIDPAASLFDVGAGVLANVYRTEVGDPLVSGYTTITADVTALQGRTVRLRFAQVGRLASLAFGVDAVSVTVRDRQQAPVLTPAGLALLALLLAGTGAVALRLRALEKGTGSVSG